MTASTVEFIALLIACLVGLLIVERTVWHLLHKHEVIVAPPVISMEAVAIFVRAVRMAERRDVDMVELARHLNNAYALHATNDKQGNVRPDRWRAQREPPAPAVLKQTGTG